MKITDTKDEISEVNEKQITILDILKHLTKKEFERIKSL